MKDQIIESKRGFVSYFLVTFLLFGAGVGLTGLINIFFQATDHFLVNALFLGLLLFGSLWLISSILTGKVRVSPQSLANHSCWGQQTLDWEDIKAVNAIPTYFGRYLIEIKRGNNKRHVALLTAHFSNHDVLLKAIADAAYRANPNVKLNAWLEAEYGKPPYGIFREVKRVS